MAKAASYRSTITDRTTTEQPPLATRSDHGHGEWLSTSRGRRRSPRPAPPFHASLFVNVPSLGHLVALPQHWLPCPSLCYRSPGSAANRSLDHVHRSVSFHLEFVNSVHTRGQQQTFL